jgi:HPt (histidine-containing phosphotransfer) domain-containing protein
MAEAIDRAHLEQLGSRFGAAFVVQLIDLFMAQGRERIVAAREAAETGDGKGVSAAAHALKSSAGNLGAFSLGSRAAEVERAGANEQVAATLTALVASLEAAFEDACAALRSLRSNYDKGGGGAG